MILEKYSFGIGDRFGHEGEAQLNALIKAANAGIEIVPVWNINAAFTLNRFDHNGNSVSIY